MLCFVAIILTGAVSSNAIAQRTIRTKKPDRGVYQPPVLKESSNAAGQLVDTELQDVSTTASNRRQSSSSSSAPQRAIEQVTAKQDAGKQRGVVQPASFNEPSYGEPSYGEPILEPPYIGNQIIGEEVIVDGGHYQQPLPQHIDAINIGSVEAGCGVEANCGVEMMGCDSQGCDGIGGCGNRRCGRCLPSPNGYISFSPDRWFGSAELMQMKRNGSSLPSLLTTGPTTNVDTAGEIGQNTTRVVVGGNEIFDGSTAGGRLTLGTWLDNQQNRSLIFRGWLAGEQTFGFFRDQDSLPVITRPFEDVSDNQAAQQDTLLVAFPNRATGSIAIAGDSNVYGGDISVRQFWYGIEGLSVDFLYGYQFMRLDENLAISSSSVSLDDDFAPIGSTIAISDSFDVENEFHGGQIGVATMYREGCWSLSALAKTGFGSLARRASLKGETRTSIDGSTSVDNQGLLVRDTNSGDRTDHTFGWVPEIDLTLGWRKFPRYEVTVGYHIVAMTDALQVSGTIDPNAAVNLSDPPTGQQNPTSALDDGLFYVHGVHLGLQYVY
ncbi:MAG: BBP7 family outer membrane beta-barrel protein [Pirellulaceae bacterium]